MKREQLSPVQIIRRHNNWRRGDDSVAWQHPKTIGEALDAVCDAMDNHAADIQGWQNKWQCAVDMAARAHMERDVAKTTLAKWYEWARMHGHLDHAAGIADDSRRILLDTFRPVE